MLHEEEGRDVDFNQVPVPADMLHGDALGFGMFDIFDIAARQRLQRNQGELAALCVSIVAPKWARVCELMRNASLCLNSRRER